MKAKGIKVAVDSLTPFNRDFFGSDDVVTYTGTGSIGGKASGLAFASRLLKEHFPSGEFDGVEIGVPRLTVLATGVFDRFMEENNLYETALGDLPDDRIAHEFQKARLPADLVGDLRALIATVSSPLAIRSSSLLEDAMYEPFAGVYATKMIPNNQLDVDSRFRKLTEAIKFVYASTFFREARAYIRATGRVPADEQMAVVIQEVVGTRFGDRFYPHVSGVARSYNFYPVGRARPDQGVVDLALGLGKTIVDGGLVWTYSPAYPKIAPPVTRTADLLKLTQNKFWAVNMGKPPEYDPIRETEYLVQAGLPEAEADGSLAFTASTFRPQDDRLVPGTGPDGPRVLSFAPLLADRLVPVNDLVKKLLVVCEDGVGTPVEIELAMTLGNKEVRPARIGFLQVRPMVVSDEQVEVPEDEMTGDNVLVASGRAMGNGTAENLSDVVFVRPERFEAKFTWAIAGELEEINRFLTAEGRHYLLIGFGRWGSSDPWLGTPVVWSQISGARTIVEATLPEMNVDLSQGSHFFHNLSSFQIFYFMVPHDGKYAVDWTWLNAQPEQTARTYVSHVRLARPVRVKVDGRSGRGVITK